LKIVLNQRVRVEHVKMIKLKVWMIKVIELQVNAEGSDVVA